MSTTNLNYKQTKNLIQQNFNNFPIKWAFNDSQLKQVLIDLGVTSTKELYKVMSGGLIRKTDSDAFKSMLAENDKIRTDFLNSNYENFFDAILYELHNHEYSYTYEIEPALNALGLDMDELNEFQLKALKEATKSKYHDC